MAELVKLLLDDLGLYGVVPTTFPELVVWVVSFTVAAALVSGVIKTCFIICREISDRRFRR